MTTLNTSLVDPELFKIFAFWGSILALKLLAMTPLTAHFRFKNLVRIHFINLQYKIIRIYIVCENRKYNFYIYFRHLQTSRIQNC